MERKRLTQDNVPYGLSTLGRSQISRTVQMQLDAYIQKPCSLPRLRIELGLTLLVDETVL